MQRLIGSLPRPRVPSTLLLLAANRGVGLLSQLIAMPLIGRIYGADAIALVGLMLMIGGICSVVEVIVGTATQQTVILRHGRMEMHDAASCFVKNLIALNVIVGVAALALSIVFVGPVRANVWKLSLFSGYGWLSANVGFLSRFIMAIQYQSYVYRIQILGGVSTILCGFIIATPGVHPRLEVSIACVYVVPLIVSLLYSAQFISRWVRANLKNALVGAARVDRGQYVSAAATCVTGIAQKEVPRMLLQSKGASFALAEFTVFIHIANIIGNNIAVLNTLAAGKMAHARACGDLSSEKRILQYLVVLWSFSTLVALAFMVLDPLWVVSVLYGRSSAIASASTARAFWAYFIAQLWVVGFFSLEAARRIRASTQIVFVAETIAVVALLFSLKCILDAQLVLCISGICLACFSLPYFWFSYARSSDNNR